jgi:type 1 fimbria pilin
MTKPKNKGQILRHLFLFAMLNTGLFATETVLADTGDKYNLNIAISGTVVANGSCTFNQGGTLDINFGTVNLKNTGNGTVLLDGDYQRPLVSDYSCSGDTAGLLQMKFSSASGTYENYNGTQVLGTSKGIVAIKLMVNGAPQSMGQWFTVDPTGQQVLQAQLVQISTANSSNVSSGDTFTASGTLMLAFN